MKDVTPTEILQKLNKSQQQKIAKVQPSSWFALRGRFGRLSSGNVRDNRHRGRQRRDRVSR